jgi:uncharacterized membrane-anchored protein
MSVRGALAGLSLIAGVALASLAFSAPAFADGPGQRLTRTETKAVTGVTASQNLGDGTVHLDLTSGYVFIAPRDVPTTLSRMNAVGPNAPVLGGIAQAKKRAGQADYWVAVLTYEPIGNVRETGVDEMTGISYINTVKAARPANPPLEIFAIAPSYDPGTRTLSWGERYTPTTAKPNALRYEQRVLGRSGSAGITLLGRPAMLDTLRFEGRNVRQMISFNPGQRYTDFSPTTDRVSLYNLPGLIDGKPRAAAPTQAVTEPPPESAPSAGISLADFGPGGKYLGVSFVAVGLVILSILYALIQSFMGGGDRDRDYERAEKADKEEKKKG